MRGILFVLLFTMWPGIFCWGQWSNDLSKNTRITDKGHTCFGALADDEGGALVVWGETSASGAVMYAQRYRADGTVSILKKRLFSSSGSSICDDNKFNSIQLLRQSNSDDIYVIFTLRLKGVFEGLSGSHTEYLQYQIISLSSCDTKIPVINNNENRGLNLGYEYGNSPNINFRGSFIISDGRVLAVWQQQNNPNDNNRGGGGSPSDKSDIRFSVLDAKNLTSPVAYRHEKVPGDQTLPIGFGVADRIYITYTNQSNRLFVKRFGWSASSITYLTETDIGEIFGGIPIVAIQSKTSNSGSMSIYSMGKSSNLLSDIKEHRFDILTGRKIIEREIVKSARSPGAVQVTSADFSLNTCFIYTKNGRQNIHAFQGENELTVPTPITDFNFDSDAAFSGFKIADSPEKYLMVGQNERYDEGRGSGELYGQLIRLNISTPPMVSTKEWGNNGKVISNFKSNKGAYRSFGLKNGNTFFIWDDERNGSKCNADIYCQVLDKDGNIIPSGNVAFQTPEITSSRQADLLSFEKISGTARAVCSSDTFRINFRTSGTFPTGTRIKVYVEQLGLSGMLELTEIQNFDAALVRGDFQTTARSFAAIAIKEFGFIFRIRAENGSTILASTASADKYFLTNSPAPPVIKSSNGQLSSCVSITLLGTERGGHTFDWQRNSIDLMRSSRNSIDSLVANPATGSGSYSVVAWSGNECLRCSTKICPARSNVLAIQFTNSSTPRPTVPTSDVTLCRGANASPLSAIGTNQRWYTTATGGTFSMNPPTPSTAATSIVSYYVTQTIGGCESARTEIKVTVIANPTLSISANGTKSLKLCSGKDITLGASSGFTSYRWTGPNGFSSTAATLPVFKAALSSSGLYSVQATGSCGLATDNLSIGVDPEFKNVRITPNPAIICNKASGLEIAALSDSSAGASYRWSGGGKAGGDPSKYIVANAGTYTVNLARGACFGQASVTPREEELTVAVTPPNTSNPIIVCSGANGVPMELKAVSNLSTAIITWKRDNADASGMNTGSNYTPTQTGQYYAVANFNNICTATSLQKIAIEALSNFAVNISPNNPAPLCDDRPITLTATSSDARYTGLYNYEWMQDTRSVRTGIGVNTLSTGKVVNYIGNTLVLGNESSYTVGIAKDGCKAVSPISKLTLKPARSGIIVLDYNTLEATESSDNKYEWYYKAARAGSLSDSAGYSLQAGVTGRTLLGAKIGSYLVRANRNGCGVKYSFANIIDVTTAINPILNDEWRVYPNPTTEMITVENKANAKVAAVLSIWSSMGQLLQSFSQNTALQSYPMAHLPVGVYYLKIQEGVKTVIKKIVKQ